MAALKKGIKVKQIVEIISGEIVDVKYDADLGNFEYLVGYTLANNEEHTRWFKENEVEVA